MSHLGNSGINQTKMSCKTDGAACKMDGILQAQSLGMLYVPRVTPAARIAPANQETLKRPVTTARSRGQVSSARSYEAPETAKGIPVPRTRQDARNMPTSFLSAKPMYSWEFSTLLM